MNNQKKYHCWYSTEQSIESGCAYYKINGLIVAVTNACESDRYDDALEYNKIDSVYLGLGTFEHADED